ncbi:uncharacterized protein L201_008082 [Kwoniella dendrophila CBS 6074]|uniref:Uncharacterized protein n=1 Tax=Kwoniella dendrophila CBS 6074 TaxID=1295534 RepID=A0AAX4K6D5_9TREE
MSASQNSSSESPILPPHTSSSINAPPSTGSSQGYDGVPNSADIGEQGMSDPLQGSPAPRQQQQPNTSESTSNRPNMNRARTGTVGRRRQVSILPPITTAALGDLSENHPSPPPSNGSTGRRRAHTVGVSMKPRLRIPSDFTSPNDNINDERSDRLAPLNSIKRTSGSQNVDLESGLGPDGIAETDLSRRSRARSSSNASRRSIGSAGRRNRRPSTPVEFDIGGNKDGSSESHQLDDELVGLLDVIDPQVATVNHLQNMTNSVLVPHLPQLWKRRPEVQIPHTPSDTSLSSMNRPYETSTQTRQRSATTRSRKGSISRLFTGRQAGEDGSGSTTEPSQADWGRVQPIPIPEEPLSPIREGQGKRRGSDEYTYTVDEGTPLNTIQQGSPHAIQREEMEEDIEDIKEDHQLDRHVKHILRQNRKDKAKRMLKGLWTFVKTPMGFITAIYGFLVVFWGAAIVLFLLGWIPTNSKNTQDVWVEISSQIENGLFTVTGIGLIPWRVIDTYRMSVIWTLKNRDQRLRKKMGLPKIEDENDLPDPELIKDYCFVLSEKDQKNLRYQQDKFAISQTWYRAHATATHKAFPMKFALWNTILMDGNSFFQCGTMWGLNRHQRPAWTTGCLIPLSFLCGIGAAVLIWQGSARTKKSALVSKKLRAALNVPVAIGIPRSSDGTVLNSTTNKANATDLPLYKTESPQKNSGAGGNRRTTISFAHVNNEGENQNQIRQNDSRNRGVTIASPESRPKQLDLDLGLGQVIDANEHVNGDLAEKYNHEDIAMKEVR